MKNLFKRFFRNRNNLNNTNNQNNMSNLGTNSDGRPIILNGHYHSKHDAKDIIRIIGEDPYTPGYFKSIDGKKYSEFDLHENYVYLDTAYKEGVISSPSAKAIYSKNNKLFDGLDDLISNQKNKKPSKSTNNQNYELDNQPSNFMEVDRKSYEQHSSEHNPIHVSTKNEIHSGNTSFKSEQEIKVNEDEIFMRKIMNKFDTGRNPENITINIPIPITFDLKRIADSIDLLGLDSNKIIDYITASIDKSTIQNIISLTLRNNISNRILEYYTHRDVSNNITAESNIPQTDTEINNSSSNQSKLDEYLNSLNFGKNE